MASRKNYEMVFQLNAKADSGFNQTLTKAQSEIQKLQKDITEMQRAQKDISAYQKQQQAIEATTNKIAVLQQKYDNIQKEMDETGSFSSTLSNRLLDTQQQIEKQTAKLETQNKALSDMVQKLKEAGVNTNDLAGSSKQLEAKIGDLKEEEEKVAEAAQEMGEKNSDAFAEISEAIAAAGVAAALKKIYDAYADCVSISTEFEATMSTVEALSGATGDEMAEVTAKAKELGATTAFTANEAAEAMTYMGMAGWNASEMISGMDGVLQLAAASGEDLATVSDIVTDNLTAFGLSASDTARFADILAATATNSNTSVSIMGETFKQSASIAGALGYSVEDVAVAVGLMANAGVKGSIAGTALKNTFNGLLEGATLTADAFGDVEFSALNSDGTMKSFGQTINELRGYFEQMTEAERVSNAMAIAGNRSYNGLLAIINATDEDYQSLTESINECTGSAQKMAQIKLDNLSGQMTLLSSAADAVKTTIGEGFNTELTGLAKVGTEALTMLNNFLTACPQVTRAVTTFTAVIGVAAAGLSAYVAVTKAAAVVSKLFTASIPGLNVIMGVVAGVAALSAAVAVLTTAEDEQKENIYEMSAETRELYRSLQDLESEYDEVCATMGENSQEAYKLQSQIEDLRDEYETSKVTLEDYAEALSAIDDDLATSKDTYNKTMGEIEASSEKVQALKTRMVELASSSDMTASEEAELAQIINELNTLFPTLGLNMENVTGQVGYVTERLDRLAGIEERQNKANAAYEGLSSAMAERKAAQEEYNKVLEDRTAAQIELNRLTKEYSERDINNFDSEYDYLKWAADQRRAMEDARVALEDYDEQLGIAQGTLAECAAEEERYRSAFEEASGVTADATDSTYDLTVALGEANLELEELAVAYEAAYEEAKISFAGQFGLFDTAKADMENTVAAAQTALDSQLNFWQTYSSNVATLRTVSAEDLGVTQENYDAIMAYAQSGTEEAAGFAQSLVNAVNSGNTEVITTLANTMGEVIAARDEASSQVAAWQVDLDGKCEEIIGTVTATVQDMDMNAEAKAAAESTIQGFIDGATGMTNEVVAAYTKIANAAKAALGMNTSGNGSGKHYASGTQSAERGFAMVGENGPEMVFFNGGETVLNAAATEAWQKENSIDSRMLSVGFDPVLISALSNIYSERAAQTYTEASVEGLASTGKRGSSESDGSGGAYYITISPNITIEGGDGEEAEKTAERVVELVREAMEDIAADKARTVYS